MEVHRVFEVSRETLEQGWGKVEYVGEMIGGGGSKECSFFLNHPFTKMLIVDL